MALYPRADLAMDSKLPEGRPSSVEFSIGWIVESRDEVDEILKRARRAGATITDSPHERPWGIYSGYFTDLDGHLWLVIWNPELPSQA